MKNANLPIPKLCHDIWHMYAELDEKGQYWAQEAEDGHYVKIAEKLTKLKRLLP